MSSRNVIARRRAVPVRISRIAAAAPVTSGNVGTVGRQAVVTAAAASLTLFAGLPVKDELQRRASLLSDADSARTPSAFASRNSDSLGKHATGSGFRTFR